MTLQRLLAELERDEDAELATIFRELGLLEEPPQNLDQKVISRAAQRVESQAVGLDAELLKEENAKLGPTFSALGLIEDPPPSADKTILAAAKRAAAAPIEPALRRTGLAAAAAAAFLWLRDGVRENTFAVVATFAAATALVFTTAIEKNAPPIAEVAAFQPIRSGETRWAQTDPADLQAFREGGERSAVRTSTVERTISEALAGGGDIERLGPDGTLQAGARRRFAIRDVQAKGPIDERAARLVLAAALDRAAGCAAATSTWKVHARIDGPRSEVAVAGGTEAEQRCVLRELAAIKWPVSPEKYEVRADVDLWPR